MRASALVATVAGAAGSIAFMLRAGQRTPRFLLVLFLFWVLSPFVALAWGNMVSTRWPVITRAALYAVTLVIAAGSVAIYSGLLAIAPRGSANAFVFVIVPPGSWLLMTMVMAMAVWRARTGQS